MTTVAIVNPNAAGRRTGRHWARIQAQLEAAIGPVEARFTDGPMVAVRLTREALEQGADLILAVGGDGTINEVVNGFFQDDQPVNPHAELALLPSGTGGDFRRTFDLPRDHAGQIARIAAGTTRAIDIGKLTYTTTTGANAVRYFDNIASFGISGLTDYEVNRLRGSKRLGGKFAFYYATVKSLLRYQPQTVAVHVDDTLLYDGPLTVAAVCNGRYFGGGMHMAPNASPSDGRFDVILIEGCGRWPLLRRLSAVYSGAHLDSPVTRVAVGQRIVATPAVGETPVLLDVDGETPGQLPATFEVLPQVLRLRC